jgi:hypothetical protein
MCSVGLKDGEVGELPAGERAAQVREAYAIGALTHGRQEEGTNILQGDGIASTGSGKQVKRWSTHSPQLQSRMNLLAHLLS